MSAGGWPRWVSGLSWAVVGIPHALGWVASLLSASMDHRGLRRASHGVNHALLETLKTSGRGMAGALLPWRLAVDRVIYTEMLIIEFASAGRSGSQ